MYVFMCTTHDHVMVKVEINLLTTYIKFGLTYFKLKKTLMHPHFKR